MAASKSVLVRRLQKAMGNDARPLANLPRTKPVAIGSEQLPEPKPGNSTHHPHTRSINQVSRYMLHHPHKYNSILQLSTSLNSQSQPTIRPDGKAPPTPSHDASRTVRIQTPRTLYEHRPVHVGFEGFAKGCCEGCGRPFDGAAGGDVSQVAAETAWKQPAGLAQFDPKLA